MRHVFVQVGSQNAIVNNTNKFENNSMNSLWPFYTTITEPVVVATSRFFIYSIQKYSCIFFLSPKKGTDVL